MQSYEKVLGTLKKARKELGEILSAVEVMDAITIDWGRAHTQLTSPIGQYPFYLLIETAGSSQEHDELKINAFLDTALVQNYVLNGVVTGEPAKVQVKIFLLQGSQYYINNSFFKKSKYHIIHKHFVIGRFL